MIALVVADVAGTTVEDPDGVGRALKGALSDAGVSWTDEAIRAVMGTPKPLAIEALVKEAGKERDLMAIHRDFRERMLRYYRTGPEVREIPGATDLFRLLRSRGIKVVLETGFDREILDTVLERLGWATGELDGTVASDEVANGRPAPDMVFRAMQLAGVHDASAVAKVGDTPSDLLQGTAAGCGWVVGVGSGTHTLEQLEVYPHTHRIASIRELPSIF